MKVAFVIPTYNSAVNLPALLDSFKKQTFHDFEIIIVDDPRYRNWGSESNITIKP
jgi:glycosyltransferase involved in cell wall biosynthesis